MDSETGENCPDKETGEVPPFAKVDNETGESEMNTRPKQERAKRFKIPVEKKIEKPEKNCFFKKGIATLNPQTHQSSDAFTSMLFLLPTTLFFYPILVICLSVIELVLHLWAHRKNKTTQQLGIFYQSPLHIVVKEFCAFCIEENNEKAISRLQDKLNSRYNFNIVSTA